MTRRVGRRVPASIAVALLVAVHAGGCEWDGPADDAADDPVLTTPQALPDDVRREVGDVWGRFVDTFAGRHDCLVGAELWLVDQVDGGDARYLTESARIEIRIPTTPARFRESLAHELAHHVEKCEGFDELRAELHPLLGDERPWAGGRPWEEIPSERWAEAVVALVGVERVRHADTVPIDVEVLDLVQVWAADEGSTP